MVMAQYSLIKQFYNSIDWVKFRMLIIAERGLICQKCGKVIAHEREAQIHHKIELTLDNVNNPEVTLNPDNVLVICHSCHDKIHERFGNVSKQIYIVYGSPCSGKQTFVQQQVKHNDLVISYDRLFQALTFNPLYDKPDSLLKNIRQVYNNLLDQVKTRYGNWSNAYIIGGFADHYKRNQLADNLGAELVFIECTKEEAYERLRLDPLRQAMIKEYEQYIDDWFDKYTK